MGVRTRSATSSPVKAAAVKPMPKAPTIEEKEPVKTFILPRDCSDGRFLLLSHPRDQSKRRFLFCPTKGLYEFVKIAAPALDHSSILFSPSGSKGDEKNEGVISTRVDVDSTSDENFAQGYINKDAEIYVATPYDPAFILLPVFLANQRSSGRSLFQPLDDVLEETAGQDKHLRYIFQHGKPILEVAAEQFCDSIEAGDEKMYRWSEKKLLESMIEKAGRVVAHGLPPSMEDKFISRALEKPVLSIKREDSSVSFIERVSTPDTDLTADSFESQSTTMSSAASTAFSEASTASTAVTLVEEDKVAPEIFRLQRMRTAFNFIVSSYLPIEVADRLTGILNSDQSPIIFDLLDEHLKELAGLRATAQATRSLTDFSRKRGNIDDDEAAELRTEKKRRLEEEDKRKKAGASRGVRDLKKANVTGMKKMSAFFAKKPATAQAKT